MPISLRMKMRVLAQGFDPKDNRPTCPRLLVPERKPRLNPASICVSRSDNESGASTDGDETQVCASPTRWFGSNLDYPVRPRGRREGRLPGVVLPGSRERNEAGRLGETGAPARRGAR